jgi:hypothetical protein
MIKKKEETDQDREEKIDSTESGVWEQEELSAVKIPKFQALYLYLSREKARPLGSSKLKNESDSAQHK